MNVIPGAVGLSAPRHRLDHRLDTLSCVALSEARPQPLPLRLARTFGWLPPALGTAPTETMETLLRCLPTGGWSISRDTALALAQLFEDAAPKLTIEFGSGVSTVLFAALSATRGGRVISFEEQPRFADHTRALLASFGLKDRVTLIVAPVEWRLIDGWQGWCYRPEDSEVEEALANDAADFVFIDGPASWQRRRRDTRYGTLLLARPWLARQAVFACDDALRPKDLAILRRWQRSSWLNVKGVIEVGWGLGVGYVEGLASTRGAASLAPGIASSADF